MENLEKAKPTTKIMLVTPQLAEKWLANCKRHIRISDVALSRFKKIMSSGEYLLTSDAIGFDYDGNLINGQTRLTAMVKTGITCELVVAFGLSPKPFTVIN